MDSLRWAARIAGWACLSLHNTRKQQKTNTTLFFATKKKQKQLGVYLFFSHLNDAVMIPDHRMAHV